MSVENWELGQVLTWSGKWHIPFPGEDPVRNQVRTLCGAYGYTFEGLPRYVQRLMDIAKGVKAAPVCKLCERSAAARGDSR